MFVLFLQKKSSILKGTDGFREASLLLCPFDPSLNF